MSFKLSSLLLKFLMMFFVKKPLSYFDGYITEMFSYSSKVIPILSSKADLLVLGF